MSSLVWSTSRRSSARVNNPSSRAVGEEHPSPFPSHGGFTGTRAEKHEGRNLPHRPPLGLCISGRRCPGTSFKPGNSVFLGPHTEGVRTAGGFVPAVGSIGDVLPPTPSLLRSGLSVGPTPRLSLSLLPCSTPSLCPPQPPPGLSWAHADLCLGVDRPPSLSGSRNLPHLCTSQKMQAVLSAVWLANSARILLIGANMFSTSRRVSFKGWDSVSCSPSPLL